MPKRSVTKENLMSVASVTLPMIWKKWYTFLVWWTTRSIRFQASTYKILPFFPSCGTMLIFGHTEIKNITKENLMSVSLIIFQLSWHFFTHSWKVKPLGIIQEDTAWLLQLRDTPQTNSYRPATFLPAKEETIRCCFRHCPLRQEEGKAMFCCKPKGDCWPG